MTKQGLSLFLQEKINSSLKNTLCLLSYLPHTFQRESYANWNNEEHIDLEINLE